MAVFLQREIDELWRQGQEHLLDAETEHVHGCLLNCSSWKKGKLRSQLEVERGLGQVGQGRDTGDGLFRECLTLLSKTK